MLTALFISQRLVRSIVLILLISSLGDSQLGFYQLYALIIILCVCLPQVFLQRLNVEGLRSPGPLLNSLLVCCITSLVLLLVLLCVGELSLVEIGGLALLPFMAIEVPFFQGVYTSPRLKIAYFIFATFFGSGYLLWGDGDLALFFLVESLARLAVMCSLLKWYKMVRIEKIKPLKVSFFFNGFVGISKFRVLDFILATMPVGASELVYGRFLEMFYGYTSLASNRFYAAGERLPLVAFRWSLWLPLVMLIAAISFLFLSEWLLLKADAPVIISSGLCITPLFLLLVVWWLELSYFSKVRVMTEKYISSLIYHLADFFLVVSLVLGIVYLDAGLLVGLFSLVSLVLACIRKRQLVGYE